MFVLETFWNVRAWESEFAPSWFASDIIGFAAVVQLPVGKTLLVGRNNEESKVQSCALFQSRHVEK